MSAVIPKVGICFYCRRGNAFRIYRYTSVSAMGNTSEPVHGEKPYFNQEEAKERVYKLNGWKYYKKKSDERAKTPA